MPACDTVFAARRVVLPDGVRPACVAVTDGRIVAVTPFGDAPWAATTVLLENDEVLLPGLVDTHVHLQNPGHEEWEDLPAMTAEALAGGVTTLVDMPVDSEPVTTDLPALQAKRAVMADSIWVDVGLWGGVVPANIGRLGELVDAGVLGFKAFMVSPGLEAFPPVGPEELTAALAELVPYRLPLLVHAEAASGSEVDAVRVVADAVAATGGWAHVVHVSDADSLAVIGAAQRLGARLSAESCPHYLVPPPGPVQTSPSVRGLPAAQALWRALADGVLGLVVSDHSPGDPAGDGGPPGVAAAHLRLPLTWTAMHERGLSLADLVRWCCSAPADLAGLAGKGRIEVGADADLVAFAPEQPVVASGRRPGPYDGTTLVGVARRTWLRGREAGARPHGRLLSGGAR